MIAHPRAEPTANRLYLYKIPFDFADISEITRWRISTAKLVRIPIRFAVLFLTDLRAWVSR